MKVLVTIFGRWLTNFVLKLWLCYQMITNLPAMRGFVDHLEIKELFVYLLSDLCNLMILKSSN